MSTRSRIGLQLADGSILSAYHHWDGYTSWLGRILQTHYNSYKKASELIDGGDMSSCWTDTPFDCDGKASKYGANYYSLRGEDCPPRLDNDMDEFFTDGEEYSYIFRNGNWYAYDMHQFDDKVAPEPVEIPSGALAA
ncbi:MAG: hypothetical protein EB127_15870 [Alphaproteobacteria bacterium]|nr:hypothetical protein [Alphaproteobacteria bacterium]